ncbi:hypothetical protein B0H10DRAFT_2434359 [Mycena sp. CBHHK59/15]|nr:hypothetical protein B0H10DRAFT_2434359 [Mycena sp. CBHHK59/15]
MSLVAFDQFCQIRSTDERQVLLLVHILELLDLTRKNDKAGVWTIPVDLMKKISSYVKAFVFSPMTISYRGLNKAMRECKAKGLPDCYILSQNEDDQPGGAPEPEIDLDNRNRTGVKKSAFLANTTAQKGVRLSGEEPK